MTETWWTDLWSSPMAPEYDDSDRHGLFALAVLVNDFWRADTPATRMSLAAEIRHQGQRFGLSPIDRRRLQWEIERTDEAQDRGTRRRRVTQQDPGKAPSKKPDDPRAALYAVS